MRFAGKSLEKTSNKQLVQNVFIPASGRIFSWGRGDYGQLGRSCDQSHDNNPQPIEDLQCVNSLKCGSEHNLAITGKS